VENEAAAVLQGFARGCIVRKKLRLGLLPAPDNIASVDGSTQQQAGTWWGTGTYDATQYYGYGAEGYQQTYPGYDAAATVAVVSPEEAAAQRRQQLMQLGSPEASRAPMREVCACVCVCVCVCESVLYARSLCLLVCEHDLSACYLQRCHSLLVLQCDGLC
jgi:hypothetical protein